MFEYKQNTILSFNSNNIIFTIKIKIEKEVNKTNEKIINNLVKDYNSYLIFYISYI